MTGGVALATIVLLHGLGGDVHVWDDVVARLAAKQHRVVTVALPRGDSLDAIAKQVASELRAKKATPAVVVGHSLGGMIAAHLAVVDPAAVKALVVVDAGIGPSWTAQEVDDIRVGLARDREAMLRSWFGALCKPEQLDKLLVGLRALPDDAIVGYVHAMERGAIPDGGRAIRAPTLLMTGKLLDPARAGFDHVARLRVERFPDAMHWIMWDEPDKLVATLQRFVAEAK
jgi:pimeloyl-ACP methyl ester carboxylesterase